MQPANKPHGWINGKDWSNVSIYDYTHPHNNREHALSSSREHHRQWYADNRDRLKSEMEALHAKWIAKRGPISKEDERINRMIGI